MIIKQGEALYSDQIKMLKYTFKESRIMTFNITVKKSHLW